MSDGKDELRPIPGFPNYSVTRDGRIWTTRRERVRGGWMKLSRQTAPRERLPRYLMTMGRVGGRQVVIYAHVAVALAWIGPRPSGMEVCHGDGNSLNNHVSNLRWDTHAANMRDAVRHANAKKL